MKNSPGQIVPDNHPPVWGWHKAVPIQEDFERLWMLQVMVWKLVIQVNWLPSPTARGPLPCLPYRPSCILWDWSRYCS